MFTLEPRAHSSTLWLIAAPALAVLLTIISSAILFALLGKPPLAGLYTMFASPLIDGYARTELLVKSAPMIIIALGLSLGFRAGIWNIGAEGQYTIGALAGSAVGLAFYDISGVWLLPLMALAGVAGGLLWAMIPAILKTRFNTNEILVSLMLVYVAIMLLSAMVSGPLRDPDGFNFPESRLFHDSATLPIIIGGTRVHMGVAIAFALALIAFIFMRHHIVGFNILLSGESPKAAAFSGVQSRAMVILCLAIGGGCAGLAGLFEAAGPAGQLTPSLPVGYGFTAIIVAFLGRLNPLGILLAGLVMALIAVGGERAQTSIGTPSAAIDVFQGMVLIYLLSVDIFSTHRLKRKRKV